MRKFLILLFFTCFAVPFFAQGAQKTFTLHDGELDSGSVMRRYDIFFDLGKRTLRPEDSLILSSIAEWMIYHDEFIIEVGNHTDYQNPASSSNLTYARAKSVMEKLVRLGVPAERIMAKGYGDTKNIISQSVIAEQKPKTKQDSVRQINRRTEFKIIGVKPGLMKMFLLTDTIFRPGQVLRDTRRIYYDLSKATLRPESKLYLDTIVLFLKAHPNLKIEIGNHTDTRGSYAYNGKLSELRSKSVMDYLISQGIDSSRLRAKGFGESQLLRTDKEVMEMKTKQEMEELHQQNRRTEFKIISVR